MNNPSVSVILSNYNHSLYLEKALNDILVQSFQPKEIIVIDDGSTDNSIEIIKEITRKNASVRFLRNKINQGIFYSITRGLELSSGDYIYLASADDLIYPDFFERSMHLLKQFPHAGLCSSIVESIEPDGLKIKPVTDDISLKACYMSPEECIKLLHRRGVWMGGSTTIFRREAFTGAGGLNPELGPYSDIFLEMVIALKYGVCFIPSSMGAQRLYDSSYSAKDNSNVNFHTQIISKAANLMLTTYKELFPVDFVSAWKAREIFLAKLSALRNIQRQQLAVIRGFFTKNHLIDQLVVILMKLAMQAQFLTLCLYLFLRLGNQMRFAIIRGAKIQIQRLKQKIKIW
jgi:glycosyltransferase involved in cell wall biosynthesis